MLGLLAKFGLVDPRHLLFGLEIDRRNLWTAPTISSFTVAVVLIRLAG